MSDRDSRDDFWDIEKLIPKRNTARLSPFATDTPVVDYAPAEEVKRRDERDEAERRLTEVSRGVRSTDDSTYYPTDMGLIKRVTVKKFIDKYDFYDSFRKSALLYFDYNAPRCDFAQFYSYMPQYAHLTPSEKSYYFYWRSEIRHGRYLKTDYSYLYLYVYEILNLPDKIPPEEGIRLLCHAWREYRSALPRIDLYFSIWVEDYCLVHGIKLPSELLSGFLFDCISTAPLKEFYLSDINEVGISGTEALIAYLSDYDWRRGKYAGECDGMSASTLTNSSYRDHMLKAMYLLLSEIWNKRVLGKEQKTSTLVRDAFPNSLCTHSVKCKLEIEYISLTGDTETRAAVTAAVRYTENKLRQLLGVKSRLATKELPTEYKAIIDRYFDKYMKQEQHRRMVESRPAYEKLYEAPSVAMSHDGADEIERLSWTTTARLVVDEESVSAPTSHGELEIGVPRPDPDMREEITEPGEKLGKHTEPLGTSFSESTCTEPMSDEAPDTYGLSAEDIALVRALYDGTAPLGLSTPVDTIAERVNEAFLEGFGDIIFEPSADGWQIIDDYREDIRIWLTRQK
ncbi:MAG: TerB N-terminal domain-containing protein [Clostridia bacterium]|nr:TerB N-terminal domain-containing protein [Clostridia bacterium]